MSICTNCQTENQSGSRFCRHCGTPLPEQATELDVQERVVEVVSTPAETDKVVEITTDELGHTRPLDDIPIFEPRQPGAIFGERFLMDRLVFTSEIEHRYMVIPVDAPEATLYCVCPNEECGAIVLPGECGDARFCVTCGTSLGDDVPDLLLIETLAPITGNLTEIVNKKLSHGNVRSPLAFFDEVINEEKRYCLVVPQIDHPQDRPEATLALKWGAELARGLDYLHANGVSFGGQVSDSYVGLVGERAVWADFGGSTLTVDVSLQDRRKDVRALANQLFRWLTVKLQYDYDPNLSPGVNRLLEQALGLPGFKSGQDLAEAIEKALEETSAPVTSYRSSWRTHVGMEREVNEDSLLTLELNSAQQFFSHSLGLYAVADGMGGHTSGEVASGTIIHSISSRVASDLVRVQMETESDEGHIQWLQEVVNDANQAVFDLRRSTGMDMGSTLVFMMLHGNKVYIAHVGDSRAYLINMSGIQQITTDHSLVERLVATDMITREEARSHPHRNVVYRIMGASPNPEIDVYVKPVTVGDRLLLCSDGLNGMLDDEQIYHLVNKSSSPQEACDGLVQAANEAGGKDNISAVLVEVVSPLLPDIEH